MFQAGAFQTPGFQQSHYSGGYGTGYIEALNNADRLRRLSQRVESLPEPVREPIKQAVKIESKPDRTQALVSNLEGVNLQLQRIYIDLMEQLYAALLEEEAARKAEEEQLVFLMAMEHKKRQEEEEILLLLAASIFH